MSHDLRDHPLSEADLDAVWRRFLSAVQAGPIELAELRQAKRGDRGRLISEYILAAQCRGFAFASVHEAEAFRLGRLYAPCATGRATLAPPGSPEKITQLRERAANGEHLWHPDDNTPSPLDLLLASAGAR